MSVVTIIKGPAATVAIGGLPRARTALLALLSLVACGQRASGPSPQRVQELAVCRAIAQWEDLDPSHRGTRLRDPRTGIVFRRVPAGTFEMGSLFQPLAMPRHRVTISKPFLIAETEVTAAQWRHFLVDSRVVSDVDLGADEMPAAVNHDGASAFCSLYGYALPSEAQWEWASLGGQGDADGPWRDENALREHAWFHGNAGDHARPVGTRTANGYGLFDMVGNLWEWCADYYAPFGTAAQQDPLVTEPFGQPPIGRGRVLRGGSWFTVPPPSPRDRLWEGAGVTCSVAGFRPVRAID